MQITDSWGGGGGVSGDKKQQGIERISYTRNEAIFL